MRTAGAALAIAMLLAMPAAAHAENEAASDSGLCVIAWVQVLGGSPIGFTNWFCVGECGTVATVGPLGPDDPGTLEWDVGAKVPNPFNPNIFCLLQ